MTSYSWAPGAPFKGDANEIQAEIDRIKKTAGGATPASLVTCARPKRSVLHPLIFNVGEKLAAERYYHGRAATLLNAIRIVNEEGEITHLRPNIRVQVGDEHTYLSITEEAARQQRESFLRGRLLAIRTELNELGLYPQVALVIEEALAA